MSPDARIAAPSLACLNGEPAPEAVLESWKQFLALPEAARKSVWEILLPLFARGPDPELDRRCEAFCALHGIEPPQLLKSLDVCQLLMRHAAARDLDASVLEQDLERLPGDHEAARRVLVEGYPRAREVLRAAMVRDTLLDHGKLLEGVDWRLDQVVVSDRGLSLDERVAVVTLRYQEGETLGRITLHVTRDLVKRLREVFETIPTDDGE